MGDETETTVTETDEGAVTGAALATIDDEKRELSRHPERLPMLPGELRPHPTPRQYVLIAVVLVIITAFEVAASYLDGDINSNLLIILLTVMAAVKFFLVVAWYMHLRVHHRLAPGRRGLHDRPVDLAHLQHGQRCSLATFRSRPGSRTPTCGSSSG
jgi:caa(3)-type oxidase subunit IV